MNAPRAWPCSVLWPEALDTNAATRAAPLPLPQGFTPDGDGSPCARLTRKGCRASITYLTMPRAIRRSVASARGRARSKMLGVGSGRGGGGGGGGRGRRGAGGGGAPPVYPPRGFVSRAPGVAMGRGRPLN